MLRHSVPVEWIFDVLARWRGTRRAQRVPESETHCLTCSRTLDSKPRMFVASSSSLLVGPSHSIWQQHIQQGVALTGCNRTGPQCSVSRPTSHAPGGRPGGGRPPTRPAGPPAGSVTDDDRRRQQTTDTSEHNNIGPLGGPVIILYVLFCTGTELQKWCDSGYFPSGVRKKICCFLQQYEITT